MIYQSIILTVFVLLVLLLLFANVPNKAEIEKARSEQKEHNAYQVSTNKLVIELHEQMLEELKEIKEGIKAKDTH